MENKYSQEVSPVRLLLNIFLLTILFLPLPAEAADPGSLKGKITDKTDGEAVIGASAMLENTTLGSRHPTSKAIIRFKTSLQVPTGSR